MTIDCVDPASEVITVVMNAMKAVYSKTSDCPPLGGASTTVAFFAGDGAPIEEVNCDNPLLWVRLASRHRSEIFPDPSITVSPCGGLDVLVIEMGVARCSDMVPTKARQATEAEISLDDTWRMNKIICLVSSQLHKNHHVGSDMIIPYGPEGGIIAWTTTVYISV